MSRSNSRINRFKDILEGRTQPVAGYPTDGQTFFYRNEDTPLVSLGRLPEAEAIHILRRPDGTLTAIGGYFLRRDGGEVWADVLAVPE